MMEETQLTDKQHKRYERILVLAEEMIYEQGFYKLSLEDLTRHLRVSRSTIYENFGSKEGLVEKIVERFTHRLNTGLESIVKNDALSTVEKFIAIAQTQGEIANGRNDHKLLRDLKIHLPHLYATFEKGRKKREAEGYSVIVAQGIKEGIFDQNLPPDFVLQLYLKMGQLVCDTDILEHTSMNKTEAMETVIRIFLNGAKKIK